MFDELIEWLFWKSYKSNLNVESFTDKETDRITKDMGRVADAKELFKAMIAGDKIRYFYARPERQERIKGEYLRTLYILKSMQDIKVDKQRPNTSIKSKRHI